MIDQLVSDIVLEDDNILMKCYCCELKTPHIVFKGIPNFYECTDCGCTTDDEEIEEHGS